MEQLIGQIKAKQSLLCVGLDTDITRILRHLLAKEDPFFAFNRVIIEATHPFAVAYKPDVASYEAYGEKGWHSSKKTIDYLNTSHPEIFTIADAKCGDIGNTATIYAKAFFEDMQLDSVTVTPYMGHDSAEPFLALENKSTVLLVLTSNERVFDFQTQEVEGEALYRKVLYTSPNWKNNQQLIHVAGATEAECLKEIRQIAPNHFLLVPGVGTQGGNLGKVCRYGLSDQYGLLINLSRGIIYASKGEDSIVVATEKTQELWEETRKLMTNIY